MAGLNRNLEQFKSRFCVCARKIINSAVLSRPEIPPATDFLLPSGLPRDQLGLLCIAAKTTNNRARRRGENALNEQAGRRTEVTRSGGGGGRRGVTEDSSGFARVGVLWVLWSFLPL